MRGSGCSDNDDDNDIDNDNDNDNNDNDRYLLLTGIIVGSKTPVARLRGCKAVWLQPCRCTTLISVITEQPRIRNCFNRPLHTLFQHQDSTQTKYFSRLDQIAYLVFVL